MDESRWKRLMDSSAVSNQQIEMVDRIKCRTNFVKFKPNGKTYSRIYFLALSEDEIHYVGSKSRKKYLACQIRDIEQIRSGFSSATWKKSLRKNRIDENQSILAFSIIYDNNRKSLDLLAESEEVRSIWIRSLEFLINRYRSHLRTHREITDQWILNTFNQADLDHSGKLNRQEVRRLLRLFNIELNEQQIDLFFRQANIRTDTHDDLNSLDKDEFYVFYKYLTYRPEILKIICQNNGSTSEQISEALSEYRILDKIPQSNVVAANAEKSASFFRFRRKKSISNSLRRRRSASITPDNVPSNLVQRNNFMTIEQLKDFLHNVEHISPLSIEDSARLIARFEPSSEGRQCEEIGVDGLRFLLLHDEFCLFNADKMHRIYHDMTRPLTDYFIATSHNTYIQGHQLYGECTAETYVHALRQGCRAVELDVYDGKDGEPIVFHGKTATKPIGLREILQAIEKEAFTKSPYPLLLNIENHVSYEQQSVMANLFIEIFKENLLTKALTENFQTLPSPEQLKYKILLRCRCQPKGQTTSDEKTIHPDLGKLIVYCQIASFQSIQECLTTQKSFQTISLSEKKLDDLISNESTHHCNLLPLTQHQIVRVYPGLEHHNSSNIHPPSYWVFGVQMVALNYQANDEAMHLQQGFFSDNGGCGYLLKPTCLTAKDTEFNPKEKIYPRGKRLHIQVISGQNFSKEKEKQDDDDIIDPFVKISTYGVECDYNEHRTPEVKNNGLNPIWDQKFSMNIFCSDLCLVMFQVRDRNFLPRSKLIGQTCIPFNALQLGYRHVKLFDRQGDPIQGTIFVHVKIDDF